MTACGTTFAALLTGEIPPPPQGARFDVAFAGEASGPTLTGTISGADCPHIRADGRFQLHIHATITTRDGHKISLYDDGIALAHEGRPVADLRENTTLTTSSADYAWLNPLQVWGTGTVDRAKQVIHIKGYSV